MRCGLDIHRRGGGIPLLQGWSRQDIARLGRRLRRRGEGKGVGFIFILIGKEEKSKEELALKVNGGNETNLSIMVETS